jgi:glycosyltransferase involved in cell wall biosynthesis
VTLSSERAAARAEREPKWWIVAPPAAGSFDGIAHFSAELAAAINEIEPAKVVSSHAGLAEAAGKNPKGILLQYYPGAFVTPQLPKLLSTLSRVRASGVPVVTTVHEYWPPSSGSLKRGVWRWLCRKALAAVIARSSAVVATTPYAAGQLEEAGLGPAQFTPVIPIGTGIKVSSTDRSASSGGHAPLTFVMFGQPGIFDRAVVSHVARWVAQQDPRPRLIWIARDADEMRAWWRDLGAPDVVEIHGGLPAERVSQLLSGASAGFAVYDDGASTRRSSLAALMAHGLPIVALDGRFTDDRLRKSGAFLFSPLGDGPAFVANAERLISDPALRVSMASKMSAFYEKEISWPRIAAKYLEILRAPVPPI